MKKWLLIALFSPIPFLFGGCQEYLELPFNYISKQANSLALAESESNNMEPTSTPIPDAQSSKTEIDELSGTLMAFDGSQILAELEDGSVYAFNVENASLECRQGMIAGNPIVVIYEGECNLEQPESLNILKIADPVEYEEQRIRTAVGKVTSMTLNTLSIRTEDGSNLRFSTTGTKQYYSQGLKKGTSVYIRFQGRFHKDSSGNLDTSNVKVLDISDLQEIPEPTPTPSPDPSLDEKEQIKYLTGHITSIQNYTLRIRPNGAQKTIKVDLRQITSRFTYGLSVGSRATISYTGTIDGTNLKKAQILSVVGEDLLKLPSAQQAVAVSGTIQNQTENTITIKTKDQAILVFDISKVPDIESRDLQNGDSVTLSYNPTQSADTAIYQAIELQITKTI